MSILLHLATHRLFAFMFGVLLFFILAPITNLLDYFLPLIILENGEPFYWHNHSSIEGESQLETHSLIFESFAL